MIKRSFLSALVTFALVGCETGGPPDRTLAQKPDLVVEVQTATVRRGSIPQRVSAPGTLTARRESKIGAELRGRIEQVYVAEGDRVEAGDPIFRIDPAPYEMALRQAVAGADLARAERHQLESDLARARKLRSERVIADQDVERIRTTLEAARARERQAAESVALGRHNLERTTVHAPYAGSIAERLADEGTTALVQPQTIVVVLQETHELEARAAIPESQLALIGEGDEALVHVEGIPEPIATRVSVVSDTIDPATHTYLVKMRVPNADQRLKAGVFARVELRPEAKPDVLIIPRTAVRNEDGQSRVLVVDDGRARSAPVQIGIVAADFVEILAGVEVGDEVIIGDAAHSVAPGMSVRATKDPETR